MGGVGRVSTGGRKRDCDKEEGGCGKVLVISFQLGIIIIIIITTYLLLSKNNNNNSN